MDHKQIHYKKLVSWVAILRSRYIRTLASEKVFDRMSELVQTKKVSKKAAEENVKIINEHKYFFNTVREGARIHVLIELAKFFDNDRDTLTVHHVISYARKNLSSFSLDEYAKFYKDDNHKMTFLAEHKHLTKEDLQRLSTRIRRHKARIARLKKYRDNNLAHDGLRKARVEISKRDVYMLLELVKDVIEVFYERLSETSNSYWNFEKEPVNDIDWILKKLKEAKAAHREKING
jgi:hypothetical protein